jgi:NAD-dependent deacetylase
LRPFGARLSARLSELHAVRYRARMSEQANWSDKAEALAQLWAASKRVVVFSGAGMSTESGLPDFRSAGGLWKSNQRFEELASLDGLRRWPEEFREFYRWRMQNLAEHSPHRGHQVIAQLEARGQVHAVITQNVDGFHETAGSQHVLRLHGSLRSVRCQRCSEHAPMTDYLALDGHVCAMCAAERRPNVVLFGEGLDRNVLEEAVALSKGCDLFVVLGSSLLVSPANALPGMALTAGAKLAIVNRDPTSFDAHASFVLHAEIGPVLDIVARKLGIANADATP